MPERDAGGVMRGGRSPGGFGLLLTVAGGFIVWQVNVNDVPWRKDLSSTLIGLSMISFGWSMMTRSRRRRR